MNGALHLLPNKNIGSAARMRKHSLSVLYITCTTFNFFNKIKRKGITTAALLRESFAVTLSY